MSMRYCPQCRKAISAAAEVCPYCGIGNGRSRRPLRWNWIGVAVFLLLSAGMMILLYRAGSSVRTAREKLSAASGAPPALNTLPPVPVRRRGGHRALSVPAQGEAPSTEPGSGLSSFGPESGFRPVQLADPSGRFAVSIVRVLVGKNALRKSVIFKRQLEEAAVQEKEIVYFEVTVANLGSDTAAATYLSFFLRDSGGFSYLPQRSIDYLYNNEIGPGRVARGGVVFYVVKGNRPTVLAFRTGHLNGSGEELVASADHLEGLDEFAGIYGGFSNSSGSELPVAAGAAASPPASAPARLDLGRYAPADYTTFLRIYNLDAEHYYGVPAAGPDRIGELQRLRADLLTKSYYLKLEKGSGSYDAGRGGVPITTGSEAAADCPESCGPSSSVGGFLFDTLPLYRECDLARGGCEGRLLVPTGESLGLRIDNGEVPLAVYLIFKVTGTRKLNYEVIDGSRRSLTVSKEFLVTSQVRVVAVNSLTKEILFERGY